MKNKMLWITAFLTVGFAVFLPTAILTKNTVVIALTITIGVSLYHFAMRLAVGTVVDFLIKNTADHENAWFREKSFESKLYKRLGVRKWKKHLPTYDPATSTQVKKR